MPEIKKIEKTDLLNLEPLLRASFGETLELQDEIDYFDKMPYNSWFFISEGGQPQGFIRCFEISSDLFQIELYIKPSDQFLDYIESLIRYFINYNILSKTTRVRFDILENQKETLQILDEFFPIREIKRFIHMRKQIAKTEIHAVEFSNHNRGFFEQVANILLVVGAYSVDRLQTLYTEQKLYIYCENGNPISAIYLESRSGQACEIMALATDSSKLRKGYGQKLLEGFFAWVSPRFAKIDLKVNAENAAAFGLYTKVGFELIPEQNQQWWYVPINASKQ